MSDETPKPAPAPALTEAEKTAIFDNIVGLFALSKMPDGTIWVSTLQAENSSPLSVDVMPKDFTPLQLATAEFPTLRQAFFHLSKATHDSAVLHDE